jgi:hypothetical protein
MKCVERPLDAGIASLLTLITSFLLLISLRLKTKTKFYALRTRTLILAIQRYIKMEVVAPCWPGSGETMVMIIWFAKSLQRATSTQNRTEKCVDRAYIGIHQFCSRIRGVGAASITILRQMDGRMNEILPRLLLLGGPGQLFLTYSFVFQLLKKYFITYFTIKKKIH